MSLKSISGKSVNLRLMKVRIYERRKSSVILNNKGINDIRETVEDGFDFFRIYVLS